MKKIIILITIFLCLPILVSAEEQEEGELVSSTTKYIKTTNIYGLSLNQEITEDEYENPTPSINTYAMIATGQTTYKKQTLQITNAGSSYLAEMTLNWKLLPVIRSFDVIAIRMGSGASMIQNSQTGVQKFYQNGSWQRVNYSYNGTNIVKKTNGYGISMNLVDDATGYTLYTSVLFNKTANQATVYATYQHATEDVTLAQSQNYTISAGGLGQVLYFYNGIDSKYDTMPGISCTF